MVVVEIIIALRIGQSPKMGTPVSRWPFRGVGKNPPGNGVYVAHLVDGNNIIPFIGDTPCGTPHSYSGSPSPLLAVASAICWRPEATAISLVIPHFGNALYPKMAPR